MHQIISLTNYGAFVWVITCNAFILLLMLCGYILILVERVWWGDDHGFEN